ncbi:MAG: hypothetical protein WBM28_04455 [Burkholderiales bacterium]
MLENEISKITELEHVGLALVQFAKSLVPGTSFEQSEGGRWIARPRNFVTFEIHWQRVRNIALSLRGNPTEFLPHEELPLKAGMGGYAECRITSVRQLAAASSYISRAAEISLKGATRVRTRPVLIK